MAAPRKRRGITDALMDKKSVGHILIDANDLRKIAMKNKNRVGTGSFLLASHLMREFLHLPVARYSSMFWSETSIISIKACSVAEPTCGVMRTLG